MTKTEFLSALRTGLSGLPEPDIRASLDYYSEIIDDRIEDGMTEAEAVAALGSPSEVAAQILLDAPLTKVVRARVKPSRALRAWEIVLLVLGSPLWLSLLVAMGSIVLAVYITTWSVLVAFFATALALALTGLGGIALAVVGLCRGNAISAVALLGTGLLLAGLAIFAFLGTVALTRAALRLCRLIPRAIKSCFINKGDKNQ